MPDKANAVRRLEQAAIPIALGEQEVDPEELSGEVVAAKLGMSPKQVFKTLAAKGGPGLGRLQARDFRLAT